MSHDYHQGPHRVFADGCGECVERVSKGLWGLLELDPENLLALGRLAVEAKGLERKPADASWADMKGVETVNLAVRVVQGTVGPFGLGDFDD